MKIWNQTFGASLEPGNRPRLSRQSRQNPRPDTYDPIRMVVSKDHSFDFRRRGISEMLEALRFLCSRVMYEGELLNQKQTFIMHGLLDNLLSVNDHNWNIKYRPEILKVSNMYHLMHNNDANPRKTAQPYQLMAEWNLGKILYSPHAYFGRKKFFAISRWIFQINRQLNRAPPPQSYIGVGYRDQGNTKIVSQDGTPSWQEVASSDVETKVSDRSYEPLYDKYMNSYNHFLKRIVNKLHP